MCSQSKRFICKSCHFNIQSKREKPHTFTQKLGGTSEEYQGGNQKVHTKKPNDTFEKYREPKEKPHTCTQNSDNNLGEDQARPEKEHLHKIWIILLRNILHLVLNGHAHVAMQQVHIGDSF